MKSKKKLEPRIKRKIRIREKISGTKDRPRMCVYRSLKHLYVQIIDDEEGRTLVSASTLGNDFDANLKNKKNLEAAKALGKLIAEKAKSLGITKVVFDRNGYKYHGRVKSIADAAREAGLIF